MPTAPAVTDWGTAIMTSPASALALRLGGIPKLIGSLLILILGWLMASAMATAVAALLRAVKSNDLAQRGGCAGVVQHLGIRQDAAGFIANPAKWLIRLIVLVSACDALGLPAVAPVLQPLLLWLPNLVVALVVLVLGGLAATALASLVRGAAARSGRGAPDPLATSARVAVWAFAIVVAVDQIGIAAALINTVFMAVVGAVALGLGPAFGLGGRDTAAQVVRGWYARGQQAAPKMVQAAAAAPQQASSPAALARPTPGNTGAGPGAEQSMVVAPGDPERPSYLTRAVDQTCPQSIQGPCHGFSSIRRPPPPGRPRRALGQRGAA